MSGGSVRLRSAPGWRVERGRLFVLVAEDDGDGRLGPRALVAELPEGAIIITDGPGTRALDGLVVLGLPGTASIVRALDATWLRDGLSTPEGVIGASLAAQALWAGAGAGGPGPATARVVPLDPGSVAVPPGAAAESVDQVVWVRAMGESVLKAADRPLPRQGAILAPRVRLTQDRAGSSDDPVQLEVRALADVIGTSAGRDALAELFERAVEHARRRAADDEGRALDNERDRRDHDEAAEQAGVAHLAEVVTGAPLVQSAPVVRDRFLACAAIVGAGAGLNLQAESAAIAGRAGIEAVRALARASNVRWRRVRLEGEWWLGAEDPLIGYRPDGTPLALMPVHERYHWVEGNGRTGPVDATAAAAIFDVAFVFSPTTSESPAGPGALARFAFRGARSDLIVLAVLGLIAGIVGLAVPLATGVVFGEIVPQGDRSRLAWLIAALSIAALALALLQQAQIARQTRIEVRAARRVGEAAWDRTLGLPTAVAARYGIGDLSGRIVGLDVARDVLTQAGLAGATTMLASLLVVIVLFAYNPALALVSVAGGAMALTVTLLLAAAAGRRSERVQERASEVNGFMLEILRGLPKLRVAGGEARAFEAWAARFAPAMGIDAARAQGRLQIALRVLNPIGTLLLFSAVAVRHGTEGIGVGTFMAFQATYTQFMLTVGQVGNTVGTTWLARPLLRRAAAVLAEPSESGRGRADPGVLRGAVELRDVAFRYQPDGAPVLDGLSLRAAPGEFVALVGRSGCGKSTIVRLLLGFEAPEAGSVLFDERDLGSLDVAAVRRQLGVVLQDSQLTPGSVFQNIAGGVELSTDEAWAYAELAAFDADLRAMPMGMETMVTPGAGAFSGGQRQRLLLAQALARRPCVLILDEATSALDNITQGVVAHNVARLGITRIVVAHRLSTVETADRIVVIADGRVAEEGTHGGLMVRGGAYAELVERQLL